MYGGIPGPFRRNTCAASLSCPGKRRAVGFRTIEFTPCCYYSCEPQSRALNGRAGEEMSTWHISEDSIDRYAIGALEGEALAEVEEHLLTCPDCQARLLEADEFVEVFRAAAVQPGVRPAKRRFFWQFGKVAW